MKASRKSSRRLGAVAPLTCLILVPVFMGMLAFSVDTGFMVQVRTELQNAADSAALAGAQKLMQPYVQWQRPGQSATQKSTIRSDAITAAKTAAKQYAAYNLAGDVNITVPDSDVEVGFTNAQGTYNSNPGTSTFPNTVKVTTRRDGNANGSLKLYFAPLIGTNSVDLTATASAAIYTGTITTFTPALNVNGTMLPVALDINHWNNFVATGQSPDGVTYNGPDGLPEIHVYPNPQQAPGNFALLDIGPPLNNAPAFRTWIDYGESPGDIAYLIDHFMLPVSIPSPKAWKGGPGLKSTLEPDFVSQIGVPNLIPLFVPISVSPYQAAAAQGSNAYYNIVGFAGVTISEAYGSGNNMNISLQPDAVLDPTVPFAGGMTNIEPAGASSTTTFTFLPPKLIK